MTPELPEDAAAWRTFLATRPARALWKIVQANRSLAPRLLAGFLPGPDSLRRPAVLARLADAALRDPALADALGALPHDEAPPPPPEPAPPPSTPPDEAAAKLREKLRTLRQTIQEKEARLQTLERDLAATREEAQTAQAERDREREARQQAETRIETLLRLTRTPRRAEAPRSRPAPVSPPAPPLALDEAFRRLLHHGKFDAVLDVGKELLAEPETRASERGALLLACAAAHYARGEDEAGIAMDTQAMEALLDAGRWAEAAEAFVRPLAVRPSAWTGALSRRLLRLLALAARAGEVQTLGRTLARLRFLAPESARGLQAELTRGGALASYRPLFEPLMATLGPDEPVALPTRHRNGAFLTARDLATAVAASDEALVAEAQEGIEALRQRQPDLVDRLLEAVSSLVPEAVFALTGTQRGAIVVDAANVALHHPDPLARLVSQPPASVAQLTRVRTHLLRRGYFPVVMLADASLRYRVDDRAGYDALVRQGAVCETPPGTAADEALVAEAEARRAPLVTNDRLSEWGERARSVQRLAFTLLPGGVHLTSA